ncbi:uncharacterized protein [Ptychodera flava]
MENLTPQDFPKDFEFIREVKAGIMQKIDMFKNDKEFAKEFPKYADGVFDKFPCGRKIRFVFPQSLEKTVARLVTKMQDKPGQQLFVCFIGYAKPVSQQEVDSVWDNDSVLIESLRTHPDILCYSSAEREPGGDWGNLVVFDSEDALHHWKGLKPHRYSVCELSPKFYTHVRIHGGALPSGLPSERLILDRTIYLDYMTPETKRLVKYWKNEALSESDLKKINVSIQ